MSILRLVLRNLVYFRGVDLAVIAGVAVATAVLSGALMVGDSVRTSLTELAVRRLGGIDQAVLSTQFFDQSLARRIMDDASIKGRFDVAPAIIVRGGAATESGQPHHAAVQILAVGADWVPIDPGQTVLNGETTTALGVASVDTNLVLSVPTESDIPREAALAQRSRQDTLAGLRVRVAGMVTAPGMISLFTPEGGQRAPQNAWVNLTDLQNASNRRGLVNSLFVHQLAPAPKPNELLNTTLRRVVTLDDYGIERKPDAAGDQVAFASRHTYLGPMAEIAMEKLLSGGEFSGQMITINLLNAVNRLSADGSVGATIHYAVAAGLSPSDELTLAQDEIALNQWAADRLGAKVGDLITFTFYRRQPDGTLTDASSVDRGFFDHFRVAKILPMSGIGADPTLTPTYKGMTDADSIADWKPPEEVKINRSLVTDADEAYWKQYRAAPKIFFGFRTAEQLWGDAYGTATSVRLPAAQADQFASKLLAGIDPKTMGLFFRPLRDEQIAAASGTTDFGQLFIGFSFFLIVAAILLVAMLLRLSVEQRGRQLGAMSAIGFSPRMLRRLMLIEGMLLSIIGGIVGSVIAIGYTWLMMAGLRTWWVGAVGTTAMQLHVEPGTLVLGFVISQIVALCAIVWSVRQIGKTAPATLLAGGWEASRPTEPGGGKIARRIGLAGLICGALLIVSGIFHLIGQQVAFLSGGAILLTASLTLLAGALKPRRGQAVIASIQRLGIRNATRHPARSVLCIGLIALAAFALVTVSSMREGESSDTGDPHSGAGGYQLIVESDIPLLANPGTEQGRQVLGFREPANPIWNRAEFLPIRRKSGQDVSCLNLTKAISPTILGIPKSMIDRGGFVSGDANPWKQLEEPPVNGEIPILAESNTATYILHMGVGDTIDVLDSAGQPRRLRLVGTLPHIIFQSQLLMSEANFRQMFPTQSGFGVVLVKAPPADQDEIRRELGNEMNEFGANVQTTASLLASYMAVQNTYLSTFELLGSLGLMLGTVGLAVVLVRTVIERQSELTLMAALGMRRKTRIRLVLTENLFLLLTGMVVGTCCALIGVLPAIIDSSRGVNVTALGLTLLAAILFGVAASIIAVMIVGLHPSAADLRRE